MSSSFKKYIKNFTNFPRARGLYILFLINLFIYNYMLLSLYVINMLYSNIHLISIPARPPLLYTQKIILSIHILNFFVNIL